MQKFLFLISMFMGVAQAGEILTVKGKVMLVDFSAKHVELTVPAYRLLTVGGKICLQGTTETKGVMDLKCGKVLAMYKDKALVEISKGGMSFQLGEFVSILTENKVASADRMIASYYDTTTGETPARSGIAAGMSFGLNYFFPSVHAEFEVSPAVTIGVVGIYGDSQSNNNRNKTYGGLLSVTYYTPQPTLGLNFEFLTGVYSSDIQIGTASEQITSIVGAALVGWKGYLSDQFFYRGSAGTQYVHNTQDASYLNFSGFFPYFRAEVGMAF
ncbi:MAG: hypothetical protein EB078_07375 [Proteobacteria bacterium]|nr:hypothetical protein [Pseudomonadota bacterium]NDC24829.1 hypothetical protein [Pseudomonadota bacterium]NDD04710.1 hypothetical protein [Pseudomonadota bacterium]NDG27172.1 hypothetical protein [Pseudomonadota bacterium]